MTDWKQTVPGPYEIIVPQVQAALALLDGLGSYAVAALPTVGIPEGALAVVTDDLRGLWRHTGSQWVSVTGYANVKDFGAKGDGKRVTDAVLTSGSGIVTSATAAFTSADVGKLANAWKEGGSATIALGTIASYQSPTQVTLSNNASASASACALRWGTNDRTAINAAIAAVTNRGGGRVFFPKGVYKVSATFDGSTNSVVTFPAFTAHSAPLPKIDVLLEGECWDFAAAIHPTSAADIDATGISGSGTQPALIAPKAFGAIASLSDFSAVQPSIKNLRFVFSENPAITGLQFHNCTTLITDNVTVSVDSTDDTIAEPTNSQSYAIIWPARSNDTQLFCRGGFIQGFFNAVGFSEHFKPWGLQIRKCKQAMVAEQAFHLNSGQLLIEQCGVMLSVEGSCRMDFEWVVERNDADTGQWFAKQTYDIVDASNLGEGLIRYVNAVSYTGDSGSATRLTRNGGFNLQLRQVDNPSGDLIVVRNSANISVADSTVTILTFDTDDQDEDGAHSTSSNTERITCLEIAQVTLVATVQFAANATGIRTVQIRKWIGGTPLIIAINAGPGNASIPTTVTVVAHSTNSLGHYFDVAAYQNSGGSLNVLAVDPYSPRFSLEPIK